MRPRFSPSADRDGQTSHPLQGCASFPSDLSKPAGGRSSSSALTRTACAVWLTNSAISTYLQQCRTCSWLDNICLRQSDHLLSVPEHLASASKASPKCLSMRPKVLRKGPIAIHDQKHSSCPLPPLNPRLYRDSPIRPVGLCCLVW
jgi:hypothetical protein